MEVDSELNMAVIKRTGYVSRDNCDALVAALPTLPNAHGREYRNSDAGGDKVSVYQTLRYYSYPESLKTAWKTYMPSEVVSSYLVSTFMKLPANQGILFPTTLSNPARLNMREPVRAIGCFLSVALLDGQHLTLDGTKYDVNKGDALLFEGTYTYETEIVNSDAIWSVNLVPTWKKETYGA